MYIQQQIFVPVSMATGVGNLVAYWLPELESPPRKARTPRPRRSPFAFLRQVADWPALNAGIAARD